MVGGLDEDDPDPEDPEDPDDPDEEEPVEPDPVEEEPVEPVEEEPEDDWADAESEPDPLAPPQPAVMPRRRAQSTNVPTLSARLMWSYDIRVPSIVNAESRARSPEPSDQGITVDDKPGAAVRSLIGNPAISIRGSRPEALRPHLAAGLPRATQSL
jgi:hypothetical protein